MEPRFVGQDRHRDTVAKRASACAPVEDDLTTATRTGEVILYGLPHDHAARLALLVEALCDALARGDAATAETILGEAGGRQRRALACATPVRPDAQPMLHGAIGAMRSNDACATVALLLAAGASASAVDARCQSACHVAAAGGRSGALQLLLGQPAGAAGAALRDRDGHTALAVALASRPHTPEHCECVALLLRAGCAAEGALSRVSRRGAAQTQLHLAAAAACARCVELLLARGADPQARTKGCGRTPVHLGAAHDPSGRVVELLLRASADCAQRDTRGEAAVHAAAAACNGRALFRLAGVAPASARWRDSRGCSPLHHLVHAAAEGAAALAPSAVGRVGRLLLQLRADPNARQVAAAADARAQPTPLSAAVDELARCRAAPAAARLLELCAVLIDGRAAVDARALALLRAGPYAAEPEAAGGPGPGAAAARRAAGPRVGGSDDADTDARTVRGSEVGAPLPSLRALCETALVRLVDAETVGCLHDAATALDAHALRHACEDYALQLGGGSLGAIRTVLGQMASTWLAPLASRPDGEAASAATASETR